MTQQISVQNNKQRYAKEIPVSSAPNSEVTSASLSAGTSVSSALKTALDKGELSLRVDRLLDLGESKSAVFSVCYQAVNAEGKKLGEPVTLKPPIIVANVGDETYLSRKNTALIAALEKHVENLPKVVLISRDAQPALALVIDKESCPSLWQELSNGAKLNSTFARKSGDYSIHNLELVSSDGIKSNVVGVYQNKLSVCANILEYEAQRILDLRATPSNEQQLRARFIGARGVVLSENSQFVVSSTELGDYYCEGMMFAPQYVAEYEHGCSILKNSRGEPLTGFMHIPRDDYSTKQNVKLSEAQVTARHKQNSEVIGKALLGYLDQALDRDSGLTKFKVLIAGYDGHVENNPSGEFAISTQPIANAISHAFGADVKKIELLSPDTPRKLRADIVYQDREISIEIVGQSFAVKSSTLDFGSSSIQNLIRTEKPQAVIGLGVGNVPTSGKAPMWFYEAGTKADAALLLNVAELKNAFKLEAGLTLPENHSLSGAIYSGDQILKVRNRLNQ